MIILYDKEGMNDECKTDFELGCEQIFSYLQYLGFRPHNIMKNEDATTELIGGNWVVAAINDSIVKNCLFLYYMEMLKTLYSSRYIRMTLLSDKMSFFMPEVFSWTRNVDNIHFQGCKDAYGATIRLIYAYIEMIECKYNGFRYVISDNRMWFRSRPFLKTMINELKQMDEYDYHTKIIYLWIMMHFIEQELEVDRNELFQAGCSYDLLFNIVQFVYNYSGTLMPCFKEESDLMEKCFLLAFEHVNLYN